MATTPPYTALASVYDAVMDHVDYESWATHVLSLVDRYAARFNSCLELGCGTGRLAEEILLDRNVAYTATDLSPAMIEVARKRLEGLDVDLKQLDFLGVFPDGSFDVILLLYDGLNYLREERQVLKLLSSIQGALAPGGIAVFDQSTPANSLNNAAWFEDEGESGSIRYERSSTYDAEKRLHTTQFDLHFPDGILIESHVQRAWDKAEIDDLIGRSGLYSLTTLDGFTSSPAHEGSERIHRVVGLPPAEIGAEREINAAGEGKQLTDCDWDDQAVLS